MMFRIVLSIILLFAFDAVHAQKNYFIFIQSETGSPFYARISDKIYSSSPAGYLTISSLTDSTYNIYIGFPRSQSAEQSFIIPIDQRDRGFELKNLSSDGWILFDWQSMNLIKSQSKPAGTGGVNMERRSDPYAMLMAGVVNDSSVLYYSIAQPELPPASETVVKEEPNKIIEILVDSNSEAKVDADTATVTALAQIEKTPVEEKLQTSNDTTITIAAVELQNPERKDTSLISQKAKPVLVRELQSDLKLERWYYDAQDPADSVYVLIEADQVIEQLPVSASNEKLDLEDTSSLRSDSELSVESAKQPSDTKIVMINSDCRNFASDYDLDKLRVLLMKEKTDNARVNVARKVFRTLCFTTRQVKAMTELFSADEGKFLLFETAYPFVSDTGNFKSLEQLLSDPFYVTRFKLMTGS